MPDILKVNKELAAKSPVKMLNVIEYVAICGEGEFA
jgi:hypothetical protein